IPDPAARLDDYPHQFSGGQRQRVMIAMALACSPQLLIADEPTTGLDPLVAAQIMALVARLRRERNMAVLFVTHDLSVVREHADTIHVLYAGRSVEWGGAKEFFSQPRHPYSEALLGAVPRLGAARLRTIPGTLPEPEARPPGCRFAPRCGYVQPDCWPSYPPPSQAGDTAAACLYPLSAMSVTTENNAVPGGKIFPPLLEVRGVSLRYPGLAAPVLRDVSFSLGHGECLGIVGASGSGKTTLGRAILQMLPFGGQVVLNGQDFAALRGAARREMRRKLQVVFQDPRESMNPRMRVGEIIAEPLVLQGETSPKARVAELLASVALSPDMATRLPATLSGGQAQRVAIARALAANPDLIVLDEPTSALDVSTQAMLLNLLKDLAAQHGLSYILISHDFAVVSYMADRIAVLKEGRIVELAETARLIATPGDDYTASLIGVARR
ncbi:MAG: ABC transporter ATP-binding protein, partial [Acidocella sp.]|nr:ABC transporter ATP-binding protein [Acidocella sp.]